MTMYNGFEVIKLEQPGVSYSGNTSYSLDRAPEEIQSLPDGYYIVNKQEFQIERGNKVIQHIVFPMFVGQGHHAIAKWMDDQAEAEYQAEEKKKKDEMDIWKADLDKELTIGEDGKVQLKNWKGKKIHLIPSDEYGEGSYDVYVDDRAFCDLIQFQEDDGTTVYQCYDGVDVYFRDKNPKLAVENMLKECIHYEDEEDEGETCSTCRGGGCFHCEPHRFIDGYIY